MKIWFSSHNIYLVSNCFCKVRDIFSVFCSNFFSVFSSITSHTAEAGLFWYLSILDSEKEKFCSYSKFMFVDVLERTLCRCKHNVHSNTLTISTKFVTLGRQRLKQKLDRKKNSILGSGFLELWPQKYCILRSDFLANFWCFQKFRLKGFLL